MPAVAEAEPVEPAPARGTAAGGPARRAWRRWCRAGTAGRVVWGAALLCTVLLALMVVRLPWAGDLGIHAATLQRLRHDLTDPGDPLVDANVDSPYYSPWTVALAVGGRLAGLSTFGVLHAAAAIDLVLLLTGIHRFVRAFGGRPVAVPLALLTLTLLYGWQLFTWSGFPGLTSLALCLAYPSTFAMGATFHLWALLRDALARGWRWPAYPPLGVLLAVVLLSHQFTGVVAVVGLVAIVLGARPWPDRTVWWRLAAGLAPAVLILLAWPYYSFFALLGVGGLEAVHRPLYERVVPRFGLVSLGVAALALRWRRDRRDPLALMSALGALVYAAGGLTGHYSWGRVLPAVFVPAQVALAVEVAAVGGRTARRVLAPLTAAGLLVGCWAQAGSLGYVLRPDAVPPVLRDAPSQPAWSDYAWVRRHVRYGDVIMTDDYAPLRQAPAYGGYTVRSGYPDFFLPDAAARARDTARYFAPGTSRAERLALLRAYHVRWVIQPRAGSGGLPPGDPAVRVVAYGGDHEVLLRVVGAG